MSLVKCPECSNEISTNAKSCPKCGCKTSKSKWWLWLLLGVIGIFVVLAVVVATPEPEYVQNARQDRDFCKAAGLKSKDQCDEIYEYTIAVAERRKR